MMLGTMELDKSMYGSDRAVLVSNDSDISEPLSNAISKLPENIFNNDSNVNNDPKVIEDYTLGEYERNGSIVVRDNRAYVVENDNLKMLVTNEDGPVENQNPISQTKVNRIKGMTDIRDALRNTLKAQKQGDTKLIKETQKKLNSLYDEFVKNYGLINDNANKQAYSRDIDYFVLASSLERYDVNTKTFNKKQGFYRHSI